MKPKQKQNSSKKNMVKKINPSNEKHHYVPRFWLKRFTYDGTYLFVYDKVKDKILTKGYKSIAFEKGRNASNVELWIKILLQFSILLFSVKLVLTGKWRDFKYFLPMWKICSFNDKNILEKELSKLETYLARLVRNNINDATEEELKEIFFLSLIIMLNTPHAKKHFDNTSYSHPMAMVNDIIKIFKDYRYQIFNLTNFDNIHGFILTDKIYFYRRYAHEKYDIIGHIWNTSSPQAEKWRWVIVPISPTCLLVITPNGLTADDMYQSFVGHLLTDAYCHAERYMFSNNKACLENYIACGKKALKEYKENHDLRIQEIQKPL